MYKIQVTNTYSMKLFCEMKMKDIKNFLSISKTLNGSVSLIINSGLYSFQRTLANFHKAQKRPLLGPSSCWKPLLLALSELRIY